MEPTGTLHRGVARIRRRPGAALLALVALAALAALVLTRGLPLPGAATVQSWVLQAQGLGVGLPVLFLVAHVLATITPVPRTAFTLAAGALFGPALGLTLAMVATTVSAVLALLLVRVLGRDAVAARLRRHRSLHKVDGRLQSRGWLAVASLRLVPVVPFWLVNYSCGVSSVRVLPFAMATLFGALPGTAAVVLLGDAVTGRSSPLLLAISAGCAAVGLVGLLLDARTPIKP